MKRFLTLLILSVTLCSHAATFPNIFTTNSIGNLNQFSQSAGAVSIANGAKTTNFVTFGSTNYFANDAAGNTNGPIMLYRQSGVAPYTNLVQDYVLGANARQIINWSSTAGDGAFGQLFVNTTHSGATSSGANTEFQFSTPGYYAFGPGFGNGGNGHIQYGIGSGSGYGANNYFGYWQSCGPLSQSSPTGYSGAMAFKTSELQGAGQIDHMPAILAYSTRTNAPGRWILGLSTDLGNPDGLQDWDPNTFKAKEHIAMFDGDTNFTRVRGLFSFTNVVVSSSNIVSIDEAGTQFKLGTELDQVGTAQLGMDANFGNAEFSIFKTLHGVILNNSGTLGTYFQMRDAPGSTFAIFDPVNVGGFGSGVSWWGGSMTIGAKNAAAQKLDVIGTSAFSGVGFFTNSIVIKSNALASIPTLARGDVYLWSSNGILYSINSSPSGVLTTNKLAP